MSQLNEKIIIVIGGAGLIGSNIVREIANRNGVAVIADIDAKKSQQLVDELNKLHPNSVVSRNLNMVDVISIRDLIRDVSNQFGKIDAVVNCAYPKNKNYGRALEKVSYQDFCENLNLHLGGYFLVAQQFAEFFRLQGWGNIVNFSSIYGKISPRFSLYEHTNMTMPIEYAAIKSAINHMTNYFAQYYKNFGIRVNAVSPGGIFDGQPSEFVSAYRAYSGLKGMLSANDIVGAVLFFLSDDAKYVTGQNLIIDDGFHL